MQVVAICGSCKSGKTTTAVNLIKALQAAGHSAAYLKLSPQISLDKKNSDSHRASKAGAKAVIAQDDKQTYLHLQGKLDLKTLSSFLDADFLLAENLEENYDYKVVCAKREEELESLDLPGACCLSGIYANCFTAYKQLPVYNSNIEVEKLVHLLLHS